MSGPGTASVGVVVIGRNEGERLRCCLRSVIDQVDRVVYVDSGSTDGSVDLARAMGAEVVELDLARPFTAARARNEGIERLTAERRDLRFIQVVDGDCEVITGWLAAATAALESDGQLAAVCGRRRERHRDATIYNRLCDLEWDTPVGEARACGGDALFRRSALAEVNGYRESMIAGEEPELCVRLRERGWTIRRLDQDMTWHDAQMTRFGQWWKRTVRSGHAFAEHWALHRGSPEGGGVRDLRSIVFWGALLPLVSLGLAWPTAGLSLLLLGGYAVLWERIRRGRRRRGDYPADASLYATSCLLAKYPQLVGVVRYALNRLRRRPSKLIEYKTPILVEVPSGRPPVDRGTKRPTEQRVAHRG